MKVTTVNDIVAHQVLNENTGELEYKQFIEQKQSKHIRGGFQMVYKSYDEVLLNIVKSALDLKLIVGIRNKFTKSRIEVVLSKSDIATEFNTSPQKVSKLIQDMVTNKLLLRVDRGIYRLNPFMYIPYMSDAATLQAEWNQLTKEQL